MRLWRLDRIVIVDLLDRSFKRREDFLLSAYAAQSFGVFQEDPIDIALRFSAEAAGDAARWTFHPSQTIAYEPDGALTVHFRAGGMHEVCWHLFTWGCAGSVLEPIKLLQTLNQMAAEVTAHTQDALRIRDALHLW